MAQKFANGRWVRDGFFDNRIAGLVIGRVYLASVGPVELCLRGDFKSDLAGSVICLRNRGFEDDELAGHVLADFEVPQLGTVNLISFDPHPHLAPHPYIEWFSDRAHHYRIELAPDEAWIASPEEVQAIETDSARIRETLAPRLQHTSTDSEEADSDWV